ncbi:MAG: BamA/TamA family outer membrane protein [Caulobacteraceae bacterium]
MDEAPAQVRYSVEVEGLREVSLDNRFRDLSVLVDGERRTATTGQIAARAAEDVKLLERLLRSEGYYDGLAFQVVEPADAAGRVRVIVTGNPGERYRFGDIVITGAEPAPTALAKQTLTLQSGKPILAAEVQVAEAAVALKLPEEGYAFARVGQRDIALDGADHTGDYTLPLDAGPLASFGGYQLAGDPVFDAKHVGVIARFRPGERYDSRRVDDLRRALTATSLFSSVSVEPVKTGKPGPNGTEIVDLLVHQAKGPARNLSITAGYGTGEGIKLTGAWTHRNLFPPEGALTLNAIAGTLQQQLGATFRRSNFGQRDRTLQVSASVSHEDTAAFDGRSASISARLSRDSTPLWQKRWTYAIGPEVILTNENRFDPTVAKRVRTNYAIAAFPGQLGFDASDNLLNPTRGVRAALNISPEGSFQGGFFGYARGLLETSGYFPVGSSVVLAARARVGSIVGADRDRIAPSRRIYGGGGGSVRGFGYRQLGPLDTDRDPIGGRSQFEFAFETRYRFGDFGIVPFVDVGQVYESSLPKFSDIRAGVGIGARYYTNFGPLRVDVATPLGRRAGEPVVAVYISIGQAF